MDELSDIRSRKDVIEIRDEERLDLLSDQQIKVRKIVTTDPLAVGGGTDSIRDKITAWEADIKYYENFAYDRGLKMGTYYRVSGGKVLPRLLDRLIGHPFLAAPPPKSCGREQFNLGWLDTCLDGGETAVDVQATLTELTARGIASGVKDWCGRADELFVCGGGAHNLLLSPIRTPGGAKSCAQKSAISPLFLGTCGGPLRQPRPDQRVTGAARVRH
jgi:hypothetical protein